MQKKVNIQNKRARFEFEIIDQYTAGIVLTGTEIKSIRNSQASIRECFCEFNERGELFVVNMYIEIYTLEVALIIPLEGVESYYYKNES